MSEMAGWEMALFFANCALFYLAGFLAGKNTERRRRRS